MLAARAPLNVTDDVVLVNTPQPVSVCSRSLLTNVMSHEHRQQTQTACSRQNPEGAGLFVFQKNETGSRQGKKTESVCEKHVC
jgi:hypothetical protein